MQVWQFLFRLFILSLTLRFHFFLCLHLGFYFYFYILLPPRLIAFFVLMLFYIQISHMWAVPTGHYSLYSIEHIDSKCVLLSRFKFRLLVLEYVDFDNSKTPLISTGTLLFICVFCRIQLFSLFFPKYSFEISVYCIESRRF